MKPRTILFLAANPSETNGYALARDARAIQVELERSGCREHFLFETRWAVQPLDLLHELRKLKPTIVHFSGQSANPGNLSHGIHLQGADGQSWAISSSAIKETFSAAGSSARVVVLSACHARSHADALLAHIDCVIGLDNRITDTAAQYFAIGFYGGIAEGESVATAFDQGLAAIRLMEQAPDKLPLEINDDRALHEGLTRSSQSQADRAKLSVRAGVDAKQLVLVSVAPTPPLQDQRLLEILQQLVPMASPQPGPRPDLFREVIEPAFEDLRTVHRDYLEMFHQVKRRIPARRDHPNYKARVRAAADQLRDMRRRGAPIRVELGKLAEHLRGKHLSVQTRTFAEALLDYFPDGSIRESRQRRDAGWWKTASSSLLDQMDEELLSAEALDMVGLVNDTVAAIEMAWVRACDAFQALRMAQFD